MSHQGVETERETLNEDETVTEESSENALQHQQREDPWWDCNNYR
jgi:hypothetical protein